MRILRNRLRVDLGLLLLISIRMCSLVGLFSDLCREIGNGFGGILVLIHGFVSECRHCLLVMKSLPSYKIFLVLSHNVFVLIVIMPLISLMLMII
jgi:hypothetical protein